MLAMFALVVEEVFELGSVGLVARGWLIADQQAFVLIGRTVVVRAPGRPPRTAHVRNVMEYLRGKGESTVFLILEGVTVADIPKGVTIVLEPEAA